MTFDCIIIGAGAAGLAAGRQLCEAGKRTLLLEAQGRIGGRICTMTPPDFTHAIEAGAEFMHGDLSTTRKLLKEAGVSHYELKGEIYQLERGELLKREFFDESWEQLLGEMKRVKKDRPFGTFLDEHFPRSKYPDLHARVKRFVEGYNAADVERVSTQCLYEEWSAEKDPVQYKLEGGYTRMINFLGEQIMAKGGELKLSHPVTDVSLTSRGVEVKCNSEIVFYSRKVLVTVPISLLQNGCIRFTPALPEHGNAFDKFGYGNVIKLHFEFNRPLWESETVRQLKNVGFVFSDAAIPTWWCDAQSKHMLTGWLGGPKAKHIGDENQKLDHALLSLAYIFNTPEEQIRNGVIATHIEDWKENPWALGAYSYATTETFHAREFLNKPVDGILFFAGEALFEGASSGTVEAALASGIGVAKKILAD